VPSTGTWCDRCYLFVGRRFKVLRIAIPALIILTAALLAWARTQRQFAGMELRPTRRWFLPRLRIRHDQFHPDRQECPNPWKIRGVERAKLQRD